MIIGRRMKFPRLNWMRLDWMCTRTCTDKEANFLQVSEEAHTGRPIHTTMNININSLKNIQTHTHTLTQADTHTHTPENPNLAPPPPLPRRPPCCASPPPAVVAAGPPPSPWSRSARPGRPSVTSAPVWRRCPARRWTRSAAQVRRRRRREGGRGTLGECVWETEREGEIGVCVCVWESKSAGDCW